MAGPQWLPWGTWGPGGDAGWSGFLGRVRSDQGLEHFGEAPGGAVGTKALNAEAGALAQQEQFVGKQLRIMQSRLAAEFDNPLAAAALECLDHAPGRMIGVRQFNRGIGEGAAALAPVELEFGKQAQALEQLLLWLVDMGLLDLGPARFKLSAVFAQAFGYQLVLGGEMTVEGSFVGVGGLGDRIDAD